MRRALSEYVEHFHAERNHQGKGNVLLFPRGTNIRCNGPVQCRERLGGLPSGGGVNGGDASDEFFDLTRSPRLKLKTDSTFYRCTFCSNHPAVNFPIGYRVSIRLP
jgi:hypothetical protein